MALMKMKISGIPLRETSVKSKCFLCDGEYDRQGLEDRYCGPCNQKVYLRSIEKSQKEKFDRGCAIFGSEDFKTKTFDKFYPEPGTEIALKLAKTYEPSKKCLYFYGPCGGGKTHLAWAIGIKHFMDGYTVFAGKLREIAMELRGDKEVSNYEFFMKKLNILIVNDVGHRATPYEIDLLADLIENRCREGICGIIITSNYSPRQLSEVFGDLRVTSRIAEAFNAVEIKTNCDYRQKKMNSEVVL